MAGSMGVSPASTGALEVIRERMSSLKFKRAAVSFSGGRTSALMAALLKEAAPPGFEMKFVFANTGSEHPATYEFVRQCDEYFGLGLVIVEAKVHEERGRGVGFEVKSYASMSKDHGPFRALVNKYGIPSHWAPYCTSRLKVEPIQKYLASEGFLRGKLLNYHTFIGIRSDEIDRMSPRADVEGFSYPLVWAGIHKKDVIDFWKLMPFNLDLPGEHYGNCVFCYKKTDRKLLTLAREAPWVFDFPIEMEEKYATMKVPDRMKPFGRRFWYRKYETAAALLERAKNSQFDPYTDDHSAPFDSNLDTGGGCGESCEVYTDGVYATDVSPAEDCTQELDGGF